MGIRVRFLVLPNAVTLNDTGLLTATSGCLPLGTCSQPEGSEWLLEWDDTLNTGKAVTLWYGLYHGSVLFTNRAQDLLLCSLLYRTHVPWVEHTAKLTSDLLMDEMSLYVMLKGTLPRIRNASLPRWVSWDRIWGGLQIGSYTLSPISL